MKKTQFIDWDSRVSHMILNPRLPAEILKQLDISMMPNIHGHLWVASSGSTSDLTLYAIAKSAFLVSAKAVNDFLKVKKEDIWLNVLPHFHVGGMGIYARAYLAQNDVVDHSSETWSAPQFHSWVNDAQATLTSLVPTQVFDLVRFGLQTPKSLRAIVVGGGALDEDLYLKARALGLPLLPSYGMTECASQVATGVVTSLHQTKVMPALEILSHVRVKVIDGYLAVKSDALFTAQAQWKSATRNLEVLHRAGDWYVTSDRGEVLDNVVIVHGRDRDQVKISGELVSLPSLRTAFQKILEDENQIQNFHIFAQADQRRGFEVALAIETTSWSRMENWVKRFNAEVLPVAKIRNVYAVEQLPKSDLGKIKELELHRVLNLMS